MTAEIVFDLRNVSAGYEGRPVLTDFNLEVRRGERIAIMGRSGAGKSTLLSLLLAARPNDVALIPQSAALVKPLSVFHNVYMGRLDGHSTFYNLRNLIWPISAEVSAVSCVLDQVGLADKLFSAAGALSGGQQQRTSVARALFNGRPIILGDEPVSALDRVQGGEILKRLATRAETLILVLHDIHLALEHADRIVVIEHGRKILDARACELTSADLIAHFAGGL